MIGNLFFSYFDQVVRPAYERTLEKAREFEAKLRFVDADHQLLFQHSLTEVSSH